MREEEPLKTATAEPEKARPADRAGLAENSEMWF